MLSVIVINHHTPQITLQCLKHLYKSVGVDFETIVINNTPEDGFSQLAKKQFPQVKLIDNPRPLGFGANNNQGMKAAKGDKILLLNSDCYVYPNTLAKCYAQPYPVLGCRLVDAAGNTLSSGGYFPTLRRIAQMMFFVDNLPGIRKFIDTIHIRDTSRLQHSRELDWVQGAFLMLDNEIFRKTGGFDEKFHMYGEEMEWQYRIKQAGFKIWYYPQTKAVHLERQSVKSLVSSFAGEMKGYLYWFRKHNPSWQLPLLKFILVIGTLYKTLAWNTLGKLFGKSTWGQANWATFKQIVSAQ